MKDNKKNSRLLINLISCLVTFVITFGISFFLTPYITKKLGAEAYGFVSLANNFVNYASIVTLAINSMAARFVSLSYHKKNFEESNKYFNSVLFTNFFLILFLLIPSILTICFLPKIVNISVDLILFVKILFSLIFLNFFLGLVNSTFAVSLFIKNRVDITNLRNMESNVLRAAIMIGLFFAFGANIVFVGVGSLLATIYLLICNIKYFIKLTPELNINKIYFDIKITFKIFMSGIWNTVTKLGQVLSDGLDLLVCNWFVTPLAMGQLAISKTFSSCISTLTTNISYVFQPNMTYYYAIDDKEKEIKEIKFSMKATAFFSNILLAGVIALGMNLFKLWIPDQNIKIIYLSTFVTIIGSIVSSSINSLFNVFTITNKLKINSLVTLGQGILNILIVFILLSLNLFKGYEIVIIAGVSVFTSIVKNLTFTPMYAAKCLKANITVFYKTIFTGVFSGIILIFSFVFISKIINPINWVSLAICAIVCGLTGVFLNYLILLNKEERAVFKQTIKNMISGRGKIKNKEA